MNKQSIYLVLYMLAMILISSIPGNSIPNQISIVPDKVIHFIEYSIFGYLSTFLLYKKYNYSIFKIIIFGISFSLFDEAYQNITPFRDSSLFDVIADIFGFIFGLSITVYIRKK
tara:strand:+ start:344 stop:685 length:342 start_codon:yes stop_codon:yes gene_type:complete